MGEHLDYMPPRRIQGYSQLQFTLSTSVPTRTHDQAQLHGGLPEVEINLAGQALSEDLPRRCADP
jgi:hypothetical protein